MPPVPGASGIDPLRGCWRTGTSGVPSTCSTCAASTNPVFPFPPSCAGTTTSIQRSSRDMARKTVPDLTTASTRLGLRLQMVARSFTTRTSLGVVCPAGTRSCASPVAAAPRASATHTAAICRCTRLTRIRPARMAPRSPALTSAAPGRGALPAG